MKIIKILLIFCILFVGIVLGGVIYSDKIIYQMTKTNNSKFENIKFYIEKGEFSFDNYILNEKKLGKGKAKIKVEGKGVFNLIPSLKIIEMALENVDEKEIFFGANSQIDSYIEKIDSPIVDDNKLFNKNKYITETNKEIEILESKLLSFKNSLNDKIVSTNKLKEEYKNSVELSVKKEKLKKLNEEIKEIISLIENKKNEINSEIGKIQLERLSFLENVSTEIIKLEEELKLNDINNLNSYVLLDKGKEIAITLNKVLKIINISNEIKKIPFVIENVTMNINNTNVVFNNLNKNNENIEIFLDNSTKVTVKKENENYNFVYKIKDVNINGTFNDNKISTLFDYEKNNLLDNKIINIKTEIVMENGKDYKNINKTILTEEEKQQIITKNETLTKNGKIEIEESYKKESINFDNLFEKVNVQIKNLDKIIKDLFHIDTIIEVENVEVPIKIEENIETKKENNENEDENPTNKISNIINQLFEKKEDKK